MPVAESTAAQRLRWISWIETNMADNAVRDRLIKEIQRSIRYGGVGAELHEALLSAASSDFDTPSRVLLRAALRRLGYVIPARQTHVAVPFDEGYYILSSSSSLALVSKPDQQWFESNSIAFVKGEVTGIPKVNLK